jgi:hypothetical protein
MSENFKESDVTKLSNKDLLAEAESLEYNLSIDSDRGGDVSQMSLRYDEVLKEMNKREW